MSMTTPRVTVPVEPEFTCYRRSQITHLRPYVAGETLSDRVSISAADLEAGRPKSGDMIARNPANHDDQWLVAADYFVANFEPVSAAPAPEGGVVQWSHDLTSVPKSEPFLIAYADGDVRMGHYLDNSKSSVPWEGIRPLFGSERWDAKIIAWAKRPALANREEAPAEAGENDDDASTYRPSIAGLSDYLWNQALAADSVESRCILEMWREAVDSNAQTGESAKTLDRLCRVEDWAQAPSALRAQPPAREDAQPVWVDGVPTKHHAKEWFIAETTFGERVVLTALPEEYTYDFKTADETYIKADRIKRWMPFPDSQYLFPNPAPDALRVAVEALERIATVDMGGGFLGAQACRQVATKALSDMKANQKGGE